MDREANARDRMECMLLDTNAKPGALPLSLLKSITNNFSDDQLIGSGGFAAVYKGILRDRKVAVKRLFQELDMDEKNFNREVISLIRVKHKNIVRFLGYCSDTQGKLEKFEEKMVMADVRQRLLCFEFLPNGSLDKHIKDASGGLQWRTRYQIIKGICEGLHYLHQQKIVHLDLKPTNILLDHNMVPKIADFGLSKCFDEKQTWAIISKVVGTQGYMAPEVYSKVITMKSDIYSLGIIITEILTGQKGYLPVENVLKSWNTKFQTSHGGTFLEHVRVCAEIGFKCMDSDPEKRPSTEHIMEKLDELERTHSLFETQPSIATAAAGDQFKSQEQRNKFLVHRLYEALNGRDHAGVQALLVANLEWWFHGPPMHQHMMRMLTGSGGSRFSFAPRSVDAFGYTVITEGGDVQQGVFWVHAWTVGSHGVITQLREYFNTDLTVTLAATGKRIWPRRLPKRHLPGLVLTL